MRRPRAGLTLVLGGRKSGKTTIAYQLAQRSNHPVVVIAPCEITDDEMAERVARHQADRPANWRTVETFDLLAGLQDAGPDACVVVDALDTWLTHALLQRDLFTDDEVAPLGVEGVRQQDDVVDEIGRFSHRASQRTPPVIAIAGTVGDGIHPMSAGLRRYLDIHGLILQRIAQDASEVLLVAAGRVAPLVSLDDA